VSRVWEQFQSLLGLHLPVDDVDPVQMALRTVVIYIIALIAVRLGSTRLLSETTAFDVIVSIMLGSIMSRAINGSAPFVPTLAAGGTLIALHWLLAVLAFRSRVFGFMVKGDAILLIKEGVIQPAGMRRGHITANDLTSALRIQTNQTDPARVRLAYLERNGQISIIAYEREPRLTMFAVEDGVQTVHIQID
jgi:uncharacterized membrane protein YcaP (DUF421 family)